MLSKRMILAGKLFEKEKRRFPKQNIDCNNNLKALIVLFGVHSVNWYR